MAFQRRKEDLLENEDQNVPWNFMCSLIKSKAEKTASKKRMENWGLKRKEEATDEEEEAVS